MIGLLTGTPQQADSALLILTSSGVGYLVNVSDTLLRHALSQPQVTLQIYTHVKEDALELFGFETSEDRKLFILLLSVSGIGPKTALGLASQGAQAVIESVQQANVSFFTKVPRVGKKLAKKIILDLGSKLGAMKELSLATPTGTTREVYEALLQLGFSDEVAGDAVAQLDPELSTTQALKQALSQLQR